jgi:hypothetical protein
MWNNCGLFVFATVSAQSSSQERCITRYQSVVFFYVYLFGESIMKNILVCIALAAGALTAPVLSFAQTNGPLTRAEVRSDLISVEQAGYNPSLGSDPHYPADIEAAEAKIAASNGQAKQGYGGVVMNGTLSSGAPVRSAMNPACVGPASFCNIFFGN